MSKMFFHFQFHDCFALIDQQIITAFLVGQRRISFFTFLNILWKNGCIRRLFTSIFTSIQFYILKQKLIRVETCNSRSMLVNVHFSKWKPIRVLSDCNFKLLLRINTTCFFCKFLSFGPGSGKKTDSANSENNQCKEARSNLQASYFGEFVYPSDPKTLSAQQFIPSLLRFLQLAMVFLKCSTCRGSLVMGRGRGSWVQVNVVGKRKYRKNKVT